jgi:hypothetical protein
MADFAALDPLRDIARADAPALCQRAWYANVDGLSHVRRAVCGSFRGIGASQPLETATNGRRRKRMKLAHGLALVVTMGLLRTVLTSVAQAEGATECALTYTRNACPGQEAESYKKCDGQKSCTKLVAADSEKKCQELAIDACQNDRLTVTQSKVITATYKGKAIKSTTGKDDLCLDYPKRDAEFNQCSKK